MKADEVQFPVHYLHIFYLNHTFLGPPSWFSPHFLYHLSVQKIYIFISPLFKRKSLCNWKLDFTFQDVKVTHISLFKMSKTQIVVLKEIFSMIYIPGRCKNWYMHAQICADLDESKSGPSLKNLHFLKLHCLIFLLIE